MSRSDAKTTVGDLWNWGLLRLRGRRLSVLSGIGAIVIFSSIFVFGSRLLVIALALALVWMQSMVLVYRALRHKPAKSPHRERAETLRAELDALRALQD